MFHTILLLTISIFPGIVLLIFFYCKDKEPEPKKLILKVFLYGVLLILPAIAIEMFLGKLGFKGAFFNAFLVAGLVEEFLKYKLILQVPFKNPAFSQVTDGIIYAIVASLGFATFENILYVLQNGYGIGIVRAFTAVPLHALVSGIMGYYIGCAKFERIKDKGKRIKGKGLILAIVLHGFYNFWLFSGSYFVILSYLQVFVMWKILFIYWNHSEEPNKETPLNLRGILKYFIGRYSLSGWVKIFVGMVLLLFVAITTTGAVVSGGEIENLEFLVALDAVSLGLGYFLLNSNHYNYIPHHFDSNHLN